MNDTAREEAAALWLKIIHTYEDEPVRGDAPQTRAEIIDRLAAMIRALACIEAALAEYSKHNDPAEAANAMRKALRGERGSDA